MPKSAIAGVYGKLVFWFESNCQTVFQSACTILYSHQQHMDVPVSPTSLSAFAVITIFHFSHSTRGVDPNMFWIHVLLSTPTTSTCHLLSGLFWYSSYWPPPLHFWPNSSVLQEQPQLIFLKSQQTMLLSYLKYSKTLVTCFPPTCLPLSEPFSPNSPCFSQTVNKCFKIASCVPPQGLCTCPLCNPSLPLSSRRQLWYHLRREACTLFFSHTKLASQFTLICLLVCLLI